MKKPTRLYLQYCGRAKRPLKIIYPAKNKKENEMKKCEWKDGLFEPCERFNGDVNIVKAPTNDKYMSLCLGCGSNIKKPEPEVIIKRSGGTQVVLFEGVDYLLMKIKVIKIGGVFTSDGIKRLIKDGELKPISEIKITDEIAKLHPIVNDGWRLESVFREMAIIAKYEGSSYASCFMSPNKLSISAVSDLED